MRNWRRSVVMLALVGAMLSGHGAFGQSTRQQTSSAQSSQNSGTGAERNAGTPAGESVGIKADSPAGSRHSIAACNAVADELVASRRLIGLLELENALLKERIETEKRESSLLTELSESRRAENEALLNALAAKNETIAAKERVIESQGQLIEALKRKKASPWKRLTDVLIGVAAGAVLR